MGRWFYVRVCSPYFNFYFIQSNTNTILFFVNGKVYRYLRYYLDETLQKYDTHKPKIMKTESMILITREFYIKKLYDNFTTTLFIYFEPAELGFFNCILKLHTKIFKVYFNSNLFLYIVLGSFHSSPTVFTIMWKNGKRMLDILSIKSLNRNQNFLRLSLGKRAWLHHCCNLGIIAGIHVNQYSMYSKKFNPTIK